jgi:hypothetical protein
MHDELTYIRKELPVTLKKTGYIFIIVGLLIGLTGYFLDADRAIFSYLLSFVFLLSIALGSLFLISLEYVAGAEWSVPIRRVNEFIAALIPILAVLSVPLLLNISTLFHWSHQEALSNDTVLKNKSPYLNVTFFIIRVCFFFFIWSLFYFIFTRNSLKQDSTKDQLITKKNIKYSAVFIPIFALTSSFAAIDWMMSLEPHWFSTIFGVYFFAGSIVASLAVVTLATIKLREKRLLHPKMVDDHYFSLGALLFAFINFWGYIAFSQYMLIWYANLPEETFWFLTRWQGWWVFVSLLLIVVHFVVPYATLLSQPSKMDPKKLKFISIWLLFAHFVDYYWLIMPNLHSAKSGLLYVFFEVGFPTASIGIAILVFYFAARNKNLVPIGDPKLEKGLKFRI